MTHDTNIVSIVGTKVPQKVGYSRIKCNHHTAIFSKRRKIDAGCSDRYDAKLGLKVQTEALASARPMPMLRL